ncbi:serine protease [Candidatus Parcubacteria bacterium]|nr:MAG: serine protease [Candidatus Parcubacteria bacterium]
MKLIYIALFAVLVWMGLLFSLNDMESLFLKSSIFNEKQEVLPEEKLRQSEPQNQPSNEKIKDTPTINKTAPIEDAPTPQTTISPKIEKNIKPLSPLAFVSLDCHFEKGGFVTRGSGVIVKEKGIILTNRHVATKIEADWTDSSQTNKTKYCDVKVAKDFNQPAEHLYQASLLWSATTTQIQEPTKMNPYYDFAFLKIDRLIYGQKECFLLYPGAKSLCEKYDKSLPESFEAIPIGQSKIVIKNDWVMIAGFPAEFFSSLTLNRISGLIDAFSSVLLRASAPIEKGFSGSAVLNVYNELIGLAFAGKSGEFAEALPIDWIIQNSSFIQK